MRREWREHVLVVAMIAFGIAVATLLISAAVRMPEPDERYYYDAETLVFVSGYGEDDTVYARLQETVEATLDRHGSVEVFVNGSPGSDGLSLRGADPSAPLGAVNYALLDGRWPEAGEVALTARGVEFLEAVLGEPVTIGQQRSIGGTERTIVGIWENPNGLDDRTALVPLDDIDRWQEAALLLPAAADGVLEDLQSLEAVDDGDQGIAVVVDSKANRYRDSSTAVLAYLGGTILCFQVAILSSAGLTVLAQRRTRQLGMLSAMGTRPRRLGSVMQFTGLICGIVGGLAGVVLGAALSIVSTPLLQFAVDHRLAAFEVPWPYLLPMIPLAVVTAMAAAWWPARRVRRTSTIDAIGARRPPETRVAPSFAVGLVLMAIGGWMLVTGAPLNSPTWIVGGASALVIGALLLIPGVVSVLGALSGRAPLPTRIAWRDINRNRTRTAAAVAAAAMAVAVPFGLASFVASLSASWIPIRPANVVSVYGGNTYGLSEEEGVTFFAPFTEAAPDAELVPVIAPVDREMTEFWEQEEGEVEYVATFSINTLRGSNVQGATTAYATPELLAAMGIEPPSPDVDLLAFTESELQLPGDGLVVERRRPVADIYPQILIFGDIDGISRGDVVVSDWLLVNDTAFTAGQTDTLEAVTRTNDVFGIGLPDGEPPFLVIRTGALIAAGLLGLAIVAVSVALLRIENEHDARALNAVGASPRTSRAIGAATALGLVIAAVIVAVPSSFLALTAVYLNPDENFYFAVPWLELGVVGVIVPAVAAAGGWLFATTRVDRVRV